MILFIFLQIQWQIINKPYNDSLQEFIVHFTIPTHELKFVAEDSLFYTRYEILLKFYDKKGNQIGGDYWQRKNLKDTLDVIDSVKMVIPKTNGYFDLKIVDLYSTEIFNLKENIIPIKYLGNIQWTLNNDTLKVTFSIINSENSVKSILASIKEIEKSIKIRSGSYDDSLHFFVKEFPVGNHELNFEIFSESKRIDEVVMPFNISRPFFLDDSTWLARVNQLEYIATSSEMNKLKNTELPERDSLWLDFWKQHDPTPNTEHNEKEMEYFSRIEYCEERFTHGDKGWRSDRARIYVKYGPPDEIHSRPYELESQPSQIWYYYKSNQKFIFADRHGFGEYILINPFGSNI